MPEPPTRAGDADPDDVRGVHQRFATGVTVVTTASPDGPRGLTVNAFASISLSPPLVLVCVATSAETHGALFSGSHLGVNVLAARQREVAQRFARSGGDKFEHVAWVTGPHGCPLIDGASAHLEARIDRRLSAFTHTIFVCRVLSAASADEPPLVYLGGGLYDGRELVAVP